MVMNSWKKKKGKIYDVLTYHDTDFPAEQPDDWDEEEDGIWRRPKIPNPAYKGPWKRKVLSTY